MELGQLTTKVIELAEDMAAVKVSVAFLSRSFWLIAGAIVANLFVGGFNLHIAKKNGKK